MSILLQRVEARFIIDILHAKLIDEKIIHLTKHDAIYVPILVTSANLEENTVFFHNSFYSTIVIKSEIIDKGESILVLYRVEKRQSESKRWGIMQIPFENERFVHEIIPNYNGTLEHYLLVDAENHFNCIVEGRDWIPLYDSQGREFTGDYMPL